MKKPGRWKKCLGERIKRRDKQNELIIYSISKEKMLYYVTLGMMSPMGFQNRNCANDV